MRFRRRNSGFTLLEALLATAVLAFVAIPVMSAFSTAATQDGPRIDQFTKHEFAISLLEERVATRNLASGSGTYEDRFAFEVFVTPYENDVQTRYDDLISFTKLTVFVDYVGNPDSPVEASQIIAHKAGE